MQIIDYLIQTDEPRTMQQIADALGVTPESITDELAELAIFGKIASQRVFVVGANGEKMLQRFYMSQACRARESGQI